MATQVQMQVLDDLLAQNWTQVPMPNVDDWKNIPVGGPIKLVSPKGKMYQLQPDGSLEVYVPIGIE